MSSKGPNPLTVADGYSLTDERQPIAGLDMDFDYDEDDTTPDDGYAETGMNVHLPHKDMPKLLLSHPGEHRGDFGEFTVDINRSTALFAISAALNSCNLGYDMAVTANAGALIQDDLDLSDHEIELIVGSLNLFAMVGAIGSYYFSDNYGRRSSFMVTSVLLVGGSVVMAVGSSFAVLMTGQAFMGLGIGFGLPVDPMYIAEISPASRRGELGSWSAIGMEVGMIMGLVCGIALQNVSEESSWRYMIGAGGAMPCLVIVLTLCILPESPRWLVLRKRTREAKTVLQKIYSEDYEVKQVILDIRESIEREIIAEREMGWNILLFPTTAFQRMLLVGIGIAIAQQAVGVEAIHYFLLYILDESGMGSVNGQSVVLITLSIIKIAFTVVGGKLFDRRGRRPLLFVSLSGMAIALLMLSIDFFGSNNFSAGFGIFALSLYLSFFSIGLGFGAWLIPAEVFASSIRAKAMSIATFMNRATAALVSSTFLSTARHMSWSAYFFLLACVCFIVCVFLYSYLPETKGRSLEAMSVYIGELTGDRSILDAEAKIVREREAREYAAATAPSFQPPTAREQPPEVLQEATVVGTMS